MAITQEKTREIIDDFAKEIMKKMVKASPAETIRIDFRNGMAENREEIVYKVPLDLLRFRKENGRISSSVKTHERTIGVLDRADSKAQSLLQRFLREKDPEKTNDLKNLLRADGQRDPGIITADGFLINGNRRKVALSELRDENPGNDMFQTMKVVILPDKNDEGGPPTIKEIEQIENRYQLQEDGKAEYYGFDAALTIRDKEQTGYTLEQQMRDDPKYKLMGEKDFKRAVKKRRKEILEPLECVDEYLDAIGRPGEYTAISKGLGDREGRWQAFTDLSQTFVTKAKNPISRNKLGIDEKEAGEILQAAYTVIRMREIEQFGKLHSIMRKFHEYTSYGKKDLLELSKNVKHNLPEDEITNTEGKPISRDEIEEKWRSKYRNEVFRRLARARDAKEAGGEKDAPMTLLSDALKKLNHGNMIVNKLVIKDLTVALTRVNDIKNRVEQLKKEIYTRVKTAKKTGMLSAKNNP